LLVICCYIRIIKIIKIEFRLQIV